MHEIEAGKPIVILNDEDVKEMGLHVSDRIQILHDGGSTTAIIDITTSLVKQGDIGVYEDVRKNIVGVKEGDQVEIKPAPRPKSVEFIKKKLDGQKLGEGEIRTIIQDIVDSNLSDIELTSLVTAAYINGYEMDETVALTKAMVDTGERVDFSEETVDKHCIGGVAGNRTTLLVVPIMVAAGFNMPKTSSRAITSPAGTADTMEVLADVNFSMDELKEIVSKVNGCIIWGGSVNLAPADDKIIRVEYPLSLDPEGQVLASVMAKKKSVDSEYVVIDIPFGRGAKIDDMSTASNLAYKFIELGKRLDMAVKCLVTDGTAPIGNGIGPALEARDCLLALEGKGPTDLINKSLDLCGTLIELSGKAPAGKGRGIAEKILESGKARKKMQEIIGAQNGNPRIKPSDIVVGDKTEDIVSKHKGRIKIIDNKMISKIARVAGAPKDKEAGLYLHVGVGDSVKKGEKLFTIHATKESKLDEAVKLAQQLSPIKVGGVILKEIT